MGEREGGRTDEGAGKEEFFAGVGICSNKKAQKIKYVVPECENSAHITCAHNVRTQTCIFMPL